MENWHAVGTRKKDIEFTGKVIAEEPEKPEGTFCLIQRVYVTDKGNFVGVWERQDVKRSKILEADFIVSKSPEDLYKFFLHPNDSPSERTKALFRKAGETDSAFLKLVQDSI